MSGFKRPVNYAGYIRAISGQTKNKKEQKRKKKKKKKEKKKKKRRKKKASEFKKVTILCGIIRDSHCSFLKP